MKDIGCIKSAKKYHADPPGHHRLVASSNAPCLETVRTATLLKLRHMTALQFADLSLFLPRAEIKHTPCWICHCGDRGLAGGATPTVLQAGAEAQQNSHSAAHWQRSQKYFAHHGTDLFTEEVLLAWIFR